MVRRRGFAVGVALGCALLVGCVAWILHPSDLPTAAVMPPADHSAVLSVHADRAIVVADLDTRRIERAARGALLETAPHAYVIDAWWSVSTSRLLILTSRTGETGSSVWSWTPSGAVTFVTRIGAPLLWTGDCSLLDASQRIACAIRDGIESNHHVMHVELYGLGHPGSVERHVWDAVLHDIGRARVTPDGAWVLYSDRSPEGTHRTGSLYRAAIDGAQRTHLGPVDGNVCDIAVSNDGAHVAVGAYDGATYTACAHLWTLDLASGAAPRRIADVLPAEPHLRYRGVSSLTFSPDGSRIAFMSDEVGGCSWFTAIESCEPTLSVVGFDGRGHERISEHVLQGVIAWMQ